MQKYVLAALLGTASAIKTMDDMDMEVQTQMLASNSTEDAWPEHTAGLAEEEVLTHDDEDAWPSLAQEDIQIDTFFQPTGLAEEEEETFFHPTGLAEEEMPGMPSINVAKLDGPKAISNPAGFVPEYSHKECAQPVPMDEWKNLPAAGSGGCKTQYFWAEQGPGGIAPVAQENHRHQYCREQNWRMKPYLKERNWTVETCSEKCKSSEGCHAFFMGRDDSSGQHGKCLLFPKCDSFYYNVDWDYYLNKQQPPKCGWECMVQTNEPPKPVAKPAGPEVLCNGGFASMNGVGNWNYETPHVESAEGCLDRCAGRSDCKFIRFNYKYNQCFAYKDHSGKCIANDHDHIYAAKAAAAPAKPAEPEVLCNGGYASMNGVGNWNYETPHTASAEACLDRCAGRSDCKYIRYNYKNNNCFAYKDRSGKCYPNDHDHIYAAKAAAAPAKPEVLCNGGYASMNGVGNWNYETPHTASPEACLERCAGRSDCKYIRYNYKNNNCFAYKDRSGKCYPNDHDHIYARDGKKV